MYYVAVTAEGNSNKFKRLAYTLIDGDHQHLTLVHYLGDHTVASALPHGNSKSSTRSYMRTCPSVLHSIARSHDLPSTVYRKEIAGSSCHDQHQPVLKPRNTKQVANIQSKNRQKFRLSHDALYNLHELAFDLSGFVAKITTYPDLIVICGMPHMIQELDSVLISRSKSPTLLSYDTTFQLGDFYLSPLLFRHTLFVGSPVMPAMFLIHERKFQKVHEELLKFAGEAIPALKRPSKRIPMVTDDEKGVCNAVDQHLPGVVRLLCWNHVINAAKTWLTRHGGTAAEIPVYTSNLRELFHQKSENAYEQRLLELERKWSKSFQQYYRQSIHPEVYMSQ